MFEPLFSAPFDTGGLLHHPFLPPFVQPTSDRPPFWGKLLVWAPGVLIDGWDVEQDIDYDQDIDAEYTYYRRDKKTGYHLFITPNGDAIDGQWKDGAAQYVLHHDVLNIDEAALIAADLLEGPFFFDGAGNEVPHTWAEIKAYAAGKGSVYANDNNFLLYNEVLTGAERAKVQAYQGL